MLPWHRFGGRDEFDFELLHKPALLLPGQPATERIEGLHCRFYLSSDLVGPASRRHPGPVGLSSIGFVLRV